MQDFEYVIAGDTERHKDCLIRPVGEDLEHAQEVLERMLNNPDSNDLKLMEGHTNIRIEKTKKENCWWNDPFLAN